MPSLLRQTTTSGAAKPITSKSSDNCWVSQTCPCLASRYALEPGWALISTSNLRRMSSVGSVILLPFRIGDVDLTLVSVVSVQASNVATSQLTKPQSMAIAIGNANTSAPGEAMPLVNNDMLMAQCHTLRANSPTPAAAVKAALRRCLRRSCLPATLASTNTINGITKPMPHPAAGTVAC